MFETFDDETLQELVDILHPKLSEAYQTMAKSIFTAKQQVKKDSKQTRKSRKEQEETINNAYAKLALANKGLAAIESSQAHEQFEKHLSKTICADLVNFIFALSSDSQEMNLTTNDRAKILVQFENDIEASDALKDRVRIFWLLVIIEEDSNQVQKRVKNVDLNSDSNSEFGKINFFLIFFMKDF